jgi:CheY-like chemotaxis protein
MVDMPHKLLLADDSVTIQRVIELTFADENVQVVAVGNGQEAIDRIQRDRPDIVLADVGMPERDGYEVAAFVKGNPATANIPVVLLTGAFEPIDEGRARAAGCDGVLVKPFEPQIVIGRVKELLAGNKPAGMWSAAPVAQGPVRQAPGDLDMRPAAAQGASTDPLEAYFDQLDAAFASTATPASAGADPFAGFAPPMGASSQATGAAKRETIPLAKPAAPPASDDPLMGWDPDLGGDGPRPASFEPPAPRPAPVAAVPPPPPPVAPPVAHAAPAVQPAPVVQPVVQVTVSAPAAVAPAAPPAPAPAPLPTSLVDAFTALLEAEQKLGLVPSAASAPAAAGNNGPAPVAPITDEMLDAVTERVLQRLSADSRPAILDVAEKLVREEIERIKQAGS